MFPGPVICDPPERIDSSENPCMHPLRAGAPCRGHFVLSDAKAFGACAAHASALPVGRWTFWCHAGFRVGERAMGRVPGLPARQMRCAGGAKSAGRWRCLGTGTANRRSTGAVEDLGQRHGGQHPL